MLVDFKENKVFKRAEEIDFTEMFVNNVEGGVGGVFGP